MEKNYFFKAALVTAMALHFSSALGFAGSEGVGGGGAVVLPNQKPVSADHYVLRSGQAADFPIELRSTIELAGRVLVQYGAMAVRPQLHEEDCKTAEGCYDTRFGKSEFIANSVLHPKIEYLFVKELPKNIVGCEGETRAFEGLPAGAKVHSVACTNGLVTWIVKDLFRKMTYGEQAETIIHERLHTTEVWDVPSEVKHEFIADLTNALHLAFELYSLEKPYDDGMRVDIKPVKLSSEQLAVLSQLPRRIVQLRLFQNTNASDQSEFLSNWMVTSKGGGFVHVESFLAENAFVGIGSIVPRYAEINGERADFLRRTRIETGKSPYSYPKCSELNYGAQNLLGSKELAWLEGSWQHSNSESTKLGISTQVKTYSMEYSSQVGVEGDSEFPYQTVCHYRATGNYAQAWKCDARHNCRGNTYGFCMVPDRFELIEDRDNSAQCKTYIQRLNYQVKTRNPYEPYKWEYFSAGSDRNTMELRRDDGYEGSVYRKQ